MIASWSLYLYRSLRRAVPALLLAATPAVAITDPPGGALTGQRYRVIVSTDIGGSDFDDDQSMVHLLQYADVFDIEGLISSPPGAGRKADIDQVIDKYAQDYSKLSSYSSNYPTASYLYSISKQGAISGAPSQGWSTATDGSSHIIARALASDSRPIYVLVWGSLTDVAQAVHDNPSIKNKIRVLCTGGASGFNHNGDPAAWNYLYNSHPDLWLINCNSSFRGMYVDSWNTSQYGNGPFVSTHCAGHGALGAYCASLSSYIKAGDTPLVLYLLRGNPDDPTTNHWGGRYMATGHGAHYWTDLTDPAWASGSYNGAKTVSQYHDNFMADWAARMDRSRVANPSNTPPTVGITSPANGASFTAGANITITATASDSNGSVTKVDFYQGTTLLGTDTTSPYSFTWNAVAAGSYSLTAKATDNGGAATTSNAVNISVQGGGGGTGLIYNLAVNDSSNAADWSVEENAAVGDLQYGDRTFTFTTLPAEITGAAWVRTANDSKFYSGATLATFNVASAAAVLVAHDNRITTKPAWLADWADTGLDVLSGGSGLGFRLYQKEYAAGATVSLGNNGNMSYSTYTVFVVELGPLVTNLTVNDSSNAADWSLQSLPAVGDLQYGDRTFTFSSLPAVLAQADWIRTANDSKFYSGTTLVSFQVVANADVYVAHDNRTATKPAWLSTWTDTGLDVLSGGSGLGFRLYRKAFTAGSTVSLGNNGDMAHSNYTVFIVETP